MRIAARIALSALQAAGCREYERTWAAGVAFGLGSIHGRISMRVPVGTRRQISSISSFVTAMQPSVSP